MKRFLATLATFVFFMSVAAPAAGAYYYETRNKQEGHLGRRGIRAAALRAYRYRHNQTVRREAYQRLVERKFPAFLTVTGDDRTYTDMMKISRKSPQRLRAINGRSPNRCINRCD